MTPDDAPFILELLNEPSFISNIGDRGVRNLDDAVAYMQKGPLTMYAEHGHGLWIVDRREDGVAMGMCGLIRRAGLDDVDLGYAFLPAYWSKGYALEAATAVRNWGFEVLGLPRIVAIVIPDNQPSIRILERLAFHFEKLTKLTDDGPELMLWAVTPGDLRESTL